ncbi:MAG: hypothetical protein OEX02_09095 [Cyclobacteriaceae bacterium]|nr:hypothetical protein [Cyclobacteriaceae bacterium]
MKKLKSSIYKGIEYIRLKHLPEQQLNQFLSWLDTESIITIQVDGVLQNDCVQYGDYSFWYDSVFRATANVQQIQKVRPNDKSFKLAFNKGQ